MKSLRRLLFGIALVGLVYGACFVPAPIDPALESIAARVAADVPEDLHVRILAVPGIEGERGDELRDAIVGALDRDRDFILVERARIDAVLEEQRFQTGRLVDRDARVEFGQLLGAEGLITGEVRSFETGWFGSVAIDAHVDLLDVQRSEVLLSRDYEVTERPAAGWTTLWIVLAAVLLWIGVRVLYRFRAARRLAKIEHDVDRRKDVVGDLRRVDRLLGDLQEAARAGGGDEDGIRRLRERLADLRQQVEGAAVGDLERQPPSRDRQARRDDRAVQREVEDLCRQVDKMARTGRAIPPATLSDMMDRIAAAEAAYRARRVR